MASIKNLKKDINYILGDVIEGSLSWQLENPAKDTKKSESIIDEAITTFDELVVKINKKVKKAEQKAHFKAVVAELKEKTASLLKKIEKL